MKTLTATCLVFVFCFFVSSIYAQSPFAKTTISPFTIENFKSAVIDFDNDGVDDVIGWQAHVSNSTKLYRNNGNSTFTDVSSSVNFPLFNDGVARDFDRNGYMDVFFRDKDTLRITFNSGATFSTPAVGNGFYKLGSLFNTDSSNIDKVRIFDFDGDGIYDIVAGVMGGSSASIKARKGQLNCLNSTFDFRTDSLYTIVAINGIENTDFQFADVDNDDDFDLLLSVSNPDQYSNSSYAVYLNQNGTFTLNSTSGYSLGREWGFGTLGEFNNDGITDILSGASDCCVGGNPLYVYYSSAPGTYSASTTAIQRNLNPYYLSATVVDLNLDRKQDVVFTHMAAIGNAALQCFLNNGNNTFTESASSLGINFGPANGECCGISNFQNSTMLDLNNDKKPDLDIHELDYKVPYTVISNWQMLNTSSNNVVKLKLSACIGLKEGWGAKIKYKTGGTWTHLQHTAYASSNYPFLFLGMETNTVIDSIVVDWVGGATTIAENVVQGSFLIMQENASCSYGSLASYNPLAETISVASNSTILDAGDGFQSYIWNTGAKTRKITVTQSGNYQVTVTNGSGCSATDASYVSLLSTLPLSLVNFSAEQQGSLVNISWQTENEINVDRFNVTRSTNGIDFINIGSVPATGRRDYAYVDKHVTESMAPKLYYRLEITDRDRSTRLSRVATVRTKGNQKVFTIVPNPARNVTNLSFNSGVENASIQVYNSVGVKVIAQLLKTSSRTAILNTGNLPSGIYIVEVQQGTERHQQRLMINR